MKNRGNRVLSSSCTSLGVRAPIQILKFYRKSPKPSSFGIERNPFPSRSWDQPAYQKKCSQVRKAVNLNGDTHMYRDFDLSRLQLFWVIFCKLSIGSLLRFVRGPAELFWL